MIYIKKASEMEENPEDKKQEIADYVNEARMAATAMIANEKSVPEWLNVINYNIFEDCTDDYMAIGLTDNSAVLAAYKIGRIYHNYNDYITALNAYDDYVNYVNENYGDYDGLKALAKNGVKTIYIPPFPKITGKRSNRELIESGIAFSERDDEMPFDSDIVKMVASSLPQFEITSEENLTEEDREELRRAERERQIQIRRSEVYVTGGSAIQSSSIIISNKKDDNDAIGALLSGQSIDTTDNDSVTAFLDFYEREAKLDPDYDDVGVTLDAQFTHIDGVVRRTQRATKHMQTDLLKIFVENGFDALGSATGGSFDRDAVRALDGAVRMQFDTRDMSMEDKLNHIKHNVDQRQAIQRRNAADSRLTSMLANCKMSLGDIDREAVNGFRLGSVIQDFDETDYDE